MTAANAEVTTNPLATFKNSDEVNKWFEENNIVEGHGAYIDEDGNEYHILEGDVADSGAQFILVAAKRHNDRGCNANSGGASWYGPGFNGHTTANNEIFNQNALTAAHRSLKFGSIVRVTFKGKSVDVRINDDGPYANGRVIDLSKEAARQIGLIGPGHGQVKLEVLSCG